MPHDASIALTRPPSLHRLTAALLLSCKHTSQADKLQAEICTLFPLGIDYCATIVGCGLEASKPFLLQEFAMYYSLKKHLNSGLQIELPEKLELFRAVYRGMSFLHSQFGRPHLRLHCNNIVITESKMLKITDYGFAHLVQHLGSHDPGTSPA
jgi:serine/threonine protein kinase